MYKKRFNYLDFRLDEFGYVQIIFKFDGILLGGFDFKNFSEKKVLKTLNDLSRWSINPFVPYVSMLRRQVDFLEYLKFNGYLLQGFFLPIIYDKLKKKLQTIEKKNKPFSFKEKERYFTNLTTKQKAILRSIDCKIEFDKDNCYFIAKSKKGSFKFVEDSINNVYKIII